MYLGSCRFTVAVIGYWVLVILSIRCHCASDSEVKGQRSSAVDQGDRFPDLGFDQSQIDNYFLVEIEPISVEQRNSGEDNSNGDRKERRKRLIEAQDDDDEEYLSYRIRFPGDHNLTLNLAPLHLDVLTPNFQVQYMDRDSFWWKNETKNRNFEENVAKGKNSCLYTARVLNDDGSMSRGWQEINGTIMNVCGGMYGMIELPQGLYFMEPVVNRTSSSSSAESVKARHVLYKYRSLTFHDSVLENSSGARMHDSDDSKTYWKRRRKSTTAANRRYYSSNASKIDNIDRSMSKNRFKRSISHEYHVELLVVADHRILRYHDRNVENYIITLLSVAASIYRHPSLEAWINIALVRLIILTHEHAGPRITSSAPETLNHFCQWQETINDNDDENSLFHHDVAILLTRHDICRSPGKCDTLGLAELGTMCNTARSCAIIQDNGLSAAFTIAHELGHIFNMPHDDDKKCAKFMPLDNNNNLRIMAHTLGSNTHPWMWSECSSKMLRLFLDETQPKCLYDRPVQQKYTGHMVENPNPGHLFNVDEQCQFIYGPSASVCSYMPTCKRLWCSSSENEAGCKTQHMPWADGTACGLNKWCYHGECVGVLPDQLEPQDGGWGAWKDWQTCSRTCGSGVQKSERFCDNPRPNNGGRYCLGQRVRYRSCNVKECPSDTPDFREVQCHEFNNDRRDIAGVPHDVRWVPQYVGISPNDRCKLYCAVESRADFYMMKNKVVDGTPCDRESDDICVDGQCKEAGCDGHLSSKAKRDHCGICGGDGTRCHKEHGSFNERTTYGYNSVVKLRSGANYIDIRQRAWNNQFEDDNYLALQNSVGEFILNGHFQVSSFHREIRVQGAILEYSGSHSAVERINSSKPILEDLYLHVLSVGQLRPPEITWEYLVLDDPAIVNKRQKFAWRLADWSECSNLCQGTQTRRPVCVSSLGSSEIDSNYCRGFRQPAIEERVCNTHCTVRWITEMTSPCSGACGATGQLEQRSTCFRVSWKDGLQERVEDRHCPVLEKPPDRIACFRDCQGRRWSYGEWSACSKTCDSGIQRRSKYCFDSRNVSVDDRYCENLTPGPTEQPCNTMPCPTWRYLDWDKCSVSCGGGLQLRHAYCVDSGGNEVDARLCNSANRQNSRKCNENVCARWNFGPWGDCSTTCGNGTSKRESRCVDPYGKALDDAYCVAEQKIVSKPCQNVACPQWRLGDWSTCSVTCMDGWKSRRVSCLDGENRELDHTYCKNVNDAETPPSHMPCNAGPCPFWRAHQWSECSVTCGHGQQKRLVECVTKDDVVDASFCRDLAKPALHRLCERIACPQWKSGRWEQCSVTCGAGHQWRSVGCVYPDTGYDAKEAECNIGRKPKSIRVCNKPCLATDIIESPISITTVTVPDKIQEIKQRDDPALNTVFPLGGRYSIKSSPTNWRSGAWSECSVTCGPGTKKRYVACMDLHNRALPDDYCSHVTKPQHTERCSLVECSGEWLASEWEPCPAANMCGVDVLQKRRVQCVDPKSRKLVPKARCGATAPEPQSQQLCPAPKCPPAAQRPSNASQSNFWRVSDWGPCSKTCGQGYQHRMVLCKPPTRLARFAPAGVSCPLAQRPPSRRQCYLAHCYHWSIGEWSPCDKNCGGGRQRRVVRCARPTDNVTVDATLCGQQPPTPVAERGCNERPCLRRFLWRTGRWSTCSVTCGNGVKFRHVDCFDNETGRAQVGNSTISCDQRTKPTENRRCRRLPLCPKWRNSQWTPCSATCGTGTTFRQVQCYYNGTSTSDESMCNATKKPSVMGPCRAAKICPFYRWEVGRWSKCSRICGMGQQTRSLSCISNYGQRAPSSECDSRRKPPTARHCASPECPYVWVPGSWSTCSKSCGQGEQSRVWHCHVKTSSTKMSPTMLPTPASAAMRRRRRIGRRPFGVLVHSRHCSDLPKPASSHRPCSLGRCGTEFSWRVATPWSQCSMTCGWGQQTRNVICVDKRGFRVDRIFCGFISKPPRRRTCFVRNCQASDCADVKELFNVTSDGHYRIMVSGRTVSIYCSGMNSSLPREYVSVRKNDGNLSNFAEFYGKRLLDPYTCPFNGARNDTCACAKEHTNYSGLTVYTKIRVDLRNMKINNIDTSFALSIYGTVIPYATAGDCYSKAKCPQGRFNIDLRGTGFRISNLVEWHHNAGPDTAKEISIEMNGAVINGRCGGYCGKCFPEIRKGLLIEVDD